MDVLIASFEAENYMSYTAPASVPRNRKPAVNGGPRSSFSPINKVAMEFLPWLASIHPSIHPGEAELHPLATILGQKPGFTSGFHKIPISQELVDSQSRVNVIFHLCLPK